jgi:Uma2 family endonuclease
MGLRTGNHGLAILGGVATVAAIAMIQALQQSVSFDEFIASHPENSEFRYELRRGGIVERPKPRGQYPEIAGFIAKLLNYTIDQTQNPYFIPRACMVKAPDEKTGYEPDGIVLVCEEVTHESRWQQASLLDRR